MKILIDGCVFNQLNCTEIIHFWQQLTPKLIERLQDYQIYFLNRTANPAFPELASLENLFAQPINFEQSALEDRRLSALCKELDITVFISTYNTSAGTQVNSLFFVGYPDPTIERANSPVVRSKLRAVKMASSYVVVSPEKANDLNSICKTAERRVIVLTSLSDVELDWDVVAHQCATSVRELSDYYPTPETQEHRLAEEEATLTEAAHLKRLAQEEAIRLENSELNRLIPPEIKDDELYTILQKIAKEEDIKTVLEIGSSSGEGSTAALAMGLRENPNHPVLFCMEISEPRFVELQKRYANDSFVKCYRASSVSIEKLPDEQEIINFYRTTPTALNNYPLERILGWLRQGIEYLKSSEIPDDGIRKIKQENNIDFFDIVLIDGSEFTGIAELEEVYGAKYICLDDIRSFKNHKNHHKLLTDPNYQLIAQNYFLRNGYSIFRRVHAEGIYQSHELPIHFFTIVLNGEPFIRYHINVFKQLPFKWHWHIIEGVADLKHDTAWSLRTGGGITDDIHRNGRSNDGTTEYINDVARSHPENITVYRKAEGVFWDGKREMVNAPLANIHEDCLLWQVDVDELWTAEQIYTVRQMFLQNPDKTAAFYWCWYFVGENLAISTRNCYTQNPLQEWLRTWRFKPGYFWAAHEPPVLVEHLPDGQYYNIATVNPFWHEETESQGLVFQHFAYVTLKQLEAKEHYYGYKNAVSQWLGLQANTKFPALLREFFSWVKDGTRVDTAESLGIVPIARREPNSLAWSFSQSEFSPKLIEIQEKAYPVILIDGVFFQLYKTGIARVWKSLLEEWVENGLAKHILVLDRANTAPKIPGIKYRVVPAYNYNNLAFDREILQQVCNEHRADLFISTYYTTPVSTPSVLMVHDMIPEVMGADPEHPFWRGKHHAIEYASAYIAVSENTARDLLKFFPQISPASVTVAHNGVKSTFSPANTEEITHFKTKYGISKPYFLLVGAGRGYKNSILFFKAFAQLPSRQGFEVVCTGSGSILETEFRVYTAGSAVHMLQLDDAELKTAYSGALALVYPSNYEGFGLPVLEAIACGCPVITCPNASIPEVVGEAALYVKDTDVDGLADALCEAQKPGVRQALIAAGLEQAKQFSWSKMAKTIRSVLMDVTLEHLNLRETNLIIFPDWSQPEECLAIELEQVVRAIATHADKTRTTLLLDTSDISEEDAALFLSGVAMNLLIQEDLDITEEFQISLVGKLSEIQWEALFLHLKARIILENENQQVITKVKATHLPTSKVGDLLRLATTD